MKKLGLSLIVMGFSTLCSAQNALSVEITNIENGTAPANMKVILEAQQKDKWVKINEASTDANGRIVALYPENKPVDKGIYKVTFETGDWFKQKNQRSFFPEIPVVFVIDGSSEHYHIPLLLSPYGYSIARGH